MEQKNVVYLLTILLVGMIFLEPVTISQGSDNMVYQSQDVQKSFTPTTVSNDSYYIIPASNNVLNNVEYKSKVEGTLTSTQLNSNSYSPNTMLYNNNNQLSSNFINNQPIASNNLFVNDTFNVPTAVQINNNKSTLATVQTTPFSLHQNEAITVFSQVGKTYFATYQHTGNFLLDISLKQSAQFYASPYLDFSVYSGNTLITSSSVTTELTFPVFSTGKNFVIVFYVLNYDNLVTITPHELTSDYYHIQNIPVNTSAEVTVDQGSCLSSPKSGTIVGGSSLYSNINVFDLPVQSNNYYEIYINQLDNYQIGCSSYSSVLLPQILNQTSSSSGSNLLSPSTVVQYISGSLDQNGYQFKAGQTGNVSLLIDAFYYMDENITVFFRQITQPSMGESTTNQVPIELNKEITLTPNVYNSFTITKPSMMAINATFCCIGPTFYRYNATSNNWDALDFNNNQFTNIDYWDSNLLGNSLFSTRSYWFYIPTGTYAMMLNYFSYNEEYTLNVVPIIDLNGTASTTVPITSSSFYAFSMSSNTFQYQTFNISTSQIDNTTVNYEYALTSKYNELIPNIYSNQELGNYYTGLEDQANNTNIYTNMKLSEIQDPIILIHPTNAFYNNNSTGSPSYTTKLTVITRIQTSGLITNGIEYLDTNAISASRSFNTANLNYVTNNMVYYYVPLMTDTNSLYNLTVSDSGSQLNIGNLTLTIFAIGGLFSDLNTHFQNIEINSKSESLRSQLILTQSNPSYLEIEIPRLNGNTNGTIAISLVKIPVQIISFGSLLVNSFGSLPWSPTITKYESYDATPLFTLGYYGKKNGSSPGFEVVIVAIAIISLPLIKKFTKKHKLE